MKRKTLGFFTALILTVSLILGGCSSVKAAVIAARFASALKESPITSVEGSLRGEVAGTALGMDSSSSLSLSFRSRLSESEGKSYSRIESQIRLLGVTVPQNFEVFHLPEEEHSAFYVHLEKPSLWARGETNWKGSGLMNAEPALLLLLVERTADSAQIETVEDQGVKNYRLSVTLAGKDFQQMLEQSGTDLPQEIRELDITGVTVPVQLEINSQTFLPQRFSLAVDGLSGETLSRILQALGREMKGITLTEGSVQLEITGFGYGPQEIPVLPEEAARSAEQMEELQSFFRRILQ